MAADAPIPCITGSSVTMILTAYMLEKRILVSHREEYNYLRALWDLSDALGFVR